MTTLKEINYSELCDQAPIEFIFNNGEIIKGHISMPSEKFSFVTIEKTNSDNTLIFKKLGITNPNQFVKDLLGYENGGIWPQVRSTEDLEKVLNALLNYNKMEEKEVKIEIPDGYEIDEANSTFTCIKFKPKQLTYDDIQMKLFERGQVYFIRENGIKSSNCDLYHYADSDNIASKKDAEKLLAMIKLMNVAHYFNNGWTPSENDKGWCIVLGWDGDISTNKLLYNYGVIKFKTKQLAEEAVKILGTETIKQALL